MYISDQIYLVTPITDDSHRMQYSNEQELVLGCKENSRSAQKKLYELYSSQFFTICSRYTKDMHDAEQVLQDSFLKIFQNIHAYQGTGSFEGWMKRIIVNTCLDHLKSKQHKADALTTHPEFIQEDINLVSFNQGYQHLNMEVLLSAIQSLSPTTRTVFNLYIFEGYSHKEIAKILSISDGTSQWHLNSARTTLKKIIINLDIHKNHEQSSV